MGRPIPPSSFTDLPRLRLGRLTTHDYAQQNTDWSTVWESVLVENDWGGTVTTLPAAVIDIHLPGRYLILLGLARTNGNNDLKQTYLRWRYNGNVFTTENPNYVTARPSGNWPWYGWLLTDVYAGPGTVEVEYNTGQPHDIIQDDETFLDIIRVSD